MKNISLLIIFFVVGLTSYAQEAIFTDRPNVTDAVKTLSQGTFQLEAGYLYQSYNQTAHLSSYPNLYIKYGLVDWLELRVLTNYQKYHESLEGGDINFDGFAPFTLSPKVKLTEQKNWIPGFSFATSLTFPNTGAAEFQNNKLNYGFRALLENEKTFPWSGSFGADWGDNDKPTWAYTWTTGTSFGGSKLGAFIEIYGYFAKEIAAQHNIDTGFTYAINNDLQVDAAFGTSLTEESQFWLGFGLAWKTNLVH